MRSRLATLRSCEARTKAPGRARTAPRSVAKSPPVSGARKIERLLRFLRNDDEDAFVADLLVPGLGAGEPVFGRLVGRAAQEGDDQQVMYRLAVGEVGMDPKAVAGDEVGHRGDGQRLAGALHANVDFRAGEVKGRGIGEGASRQSEENGQNNGGTRRRCLIFKAIDEFLLPLELRLRRWSGLASACRRDVGPWESGFGSVWREAWTTNQSLAGSPCRLCPADD